jgi:hypothetical protein
LLFRAMLIQIFFTISCLVIIQYQKMAEKIKITLSNDQKKSSDEQFLQAPRNWQKCLGFSMSTGCAVLFGGNIYVFQYFPARWYHC